MSLQLDARQRAMLAEMGVRVWLPGAGRAADPAAAPAPAAASSASVQDAALPLPSPPAPRAAPTHQSAPPPASAAPGPRPEGVAAMDWPALQAAVANCRACGLCAGRTQAVFGVGSRGARWMVVGEAPGETEDRLGQPFVGQAGKLLDNMLAAIGLARHIDATTETIADSASQTSAGGQNDQQKSGVYIANVLKCRPPGNRNPQPDEVAQCEPFLRRQVALLKPRIMLAMGRFAVQSLLQTTEPIGRLRGRVHSYQGVPVIVTYHPAYLLRALPEKARAWQDLCLALKVFEQLPPDNR